tara:strand:+ start:2048 stop:6436 length:4389 start_codon:yes stop_codon:yes gene_type:complete
MSSKSNKHTKTPWSDMPKYVPKDSRVGSGRIHPVDYYTVTSQDIATASSGSGSSGSDIGNPDNPPSGGSGGATPGAVENLVSSITSAMVNPGDITDVEPTSGPVLLKVTATVNIISPAGLTYQWQKKESGGSFSDISGATNSEYSVPSGLTVDNDSGDSYRCQVYHADAVTSPVLTNEVNVTLSRKITISAQPALGIVVKQGNTTTLTATATISSGTMTYKWQIKLNGTSTFSDIANASGTVPGNGEVSYTTGTQSTSNNGDEYRVVFANAEAGDIISGRVVMAVSGADFRLQPPINGIEFWNFEEHGALIFDPSNTTDYTITSLEAGRSKFSAHLWGQGTCGAKGGYTDVDLPVAGADVFKVYLNAGGGSAGTSDSGRYAEAGGGYAGIFDTSVSHANALAIAGGAGGASLNTASTCGGTQQTVSYSYYYQSPYQSTCYTTVNNSVRKSGGWSHSYNNATRSNNYLNWYGNTGVIYNIQPPLRYYIIGFDSPMPSGQYILSVSTSSCTAGGGACPGFYLDMTQLTRTSQWMVLAFRRNDTSGRSYVASCSWTIEYQDIQTISYPCTKYTTVQGNFSHVGTAQVLGGAGGGTTGSDGSNSTSSQISAKGGYGGSQSSAGAGGSTSSGGSTNGSTGAALQGGEGGVNSGSRDSAGGGGGGGGYYGGGGGAGGYDGYNGSSNNPNIGPQSGGGGGAGSGFVHSSGTGTTGAFGGSTHANRGSAGEEKQNSRVVIEAAFIDINTQPRSVVRASGTATFEVKADVVGVTGQTISYQWQKRASGQTSFSDISGATSATYTTPSLLSSNSGDTYRCILDNEYCASKTTDEVVTLITSSGSQVYNITQTGETSVEVPASATGFTYWLWGAGGQGVGECPTGNFSGGSGGYVTGTVTIPSNASGASYDNEQVKTGQGGLTQKPSCTSTQNGWYTRTGGPETKGSTAVRKLQILWQGSLVYDGPYSPNEDGYIIVGNYGYKWGTYRSNSAYGWKTDDTCGTGSSGQGDYCNSFDVKRYDYSPATRTISVFVGATGQGSPQGQAGYGAGRGGQRSEITFNGLSAIVGGGGGAGQNGQGGGGGGTGGGGAGTGPNTGQVSGTSGRSGGGAGGGSGVNQGNRGGGGGSGVSGGAGAGGDGNGNCTGGGGAGGSGSISLAYTSASNGNTGTAGGAAPVPASLPSEHVSGHGGASQNGLAVISMTVPGSLEIVGIASGTSTNITNLSSTNTLSEPSFLVASGFDYNVTIRLRGNTPPGVGGDGGYVQGTFTAKAGQSYRLHYDTRYSAVFYGTSETANNCIMLAAEGGYEGVPRSELSGGGHPSRPSNTPGGDAGYPGGAIGNNLNTSYGGTGGSTSGYRSGSGGNGGSAGGDLSAGAGSAGGFFSAGAGGSGIDGDGGHGGFGYYGGGGGGGGWDNGFVQGGYFGGGGGGGSSYFGGLPSPSTDPKSPAEVTVTGTSYGNETGGVQIQIISVAQA